VIVCVCKKQEAAPAAEEPAAAKSRPASLKMRKQMQLKQMHMRQVVASCSSNRANHLDPSCAIANPKLRGWADRFCTHTASTQRAMRAYTPFHHTDLLGLHERHCEFHGGMPV